MFSRTAYEGHISEAAAINSVVLQSGNSPLVISARDKDTEQNANLVFSILEDEAKAYFAIDSSTGGKTILFTNFNHIGSFFLSFYYKESLHRDYFESYYYFC